MSFFKKSQLEKIQQASVSLDKRFTVFLVDDEPANLEVMSNILSPYYEIISAANGQEALDKLTQFEEPEKLACIVSDQRMPKMTGVELFKEIKGLLPDTPRTIVTGYIDLDAIVDSVNTANIYKFIIKPFDFKDFLQTIHAAVESFEMKLKLKSYQTDLEQEVEARTQEIGEVNQSLIESISQLEETYADVLTLNKLADILQNTDNEHQALTDTARLCYQIFPLSHGAIFLFDKADSLIKKAHWGSNESIWPKELNDEALLLDAPGISVPLTHQSRILGFIVVNNTETHHHSLDFKKPMLDSLSRQLSSGLANIQLRQDLIQQAIIDPLTQVYNRQHMSDAIDKELARAERDKSSIAFIMIDVDHFKPINDTFGHGVGDIVLAEIADRLKRNCRLGDTICRYGGEEFIVILPKANLEQAMRKGEELRACVANDKIIKGIKAPLAVSISLGISTYPNNGRTKEVLLSAADKALYLAKDSGRNTLIAAS
ncbi:diguanylate cyclase [Catenovulum sp. SM1970]|uniref:GGDEF domain-containing response regulator n=1 Tax=Marinifaba aquimaris TaxID=2741323 RepID=UPI001572A962|nr:diguanylate cyclase [Marinifaba aquimaris]NTS78871.1 diguanylate cyclase [Marinifaba aquimaris]